MIRFLIICFFCVALMTTGCTPVGVAVGAGATAGVAATQEGGLERAVSDAGIQARINELWFRKDVNMFSKLDLTVNQGRVLITGVVQNPEHRVEAVRLAWQPKGVKQVINEIRVAESEGIQGFVKDNWITTRLRTELTLDRDVESLNYNIDTVQGIVYLMGYAQNQKELNRVIETARTISGVKQVVSYVKIVGQEEENDSVSGNWNNTPQQSQQQLSPSSVEAEPLTSSSPASYEDRWGENQPAGGGY